jgi:ribosomal protein S18 acetylase RimI-like enzyme
MKLIQATADDIDIIIQLAHPIWETHYVPIIGKQQVDYMLASLYSKEALLQQMHDGQVFYIAYSDNIEGPIGYMAVSNKNDDECFLHKFYLAISTQGKGLGALLFKEMEQLYPNTKEMRLTVNRQNFKSINFYFKLGFQIEKVADFDIGNNYFMNDFVMVKKYI